MSRGSSNIDDVAAWLDQMVAKVDFTRDGVDKALGRDLAGVVAEGIYTRSVPTAEAPDGSRWRDNEDPYKTWKARKYDAYQPGVLTGQMLTQESILGEVTIASDAVEMRYGTDTPASSTLKGVPVPKAKDPPTDRQKAEWFTASGREFFALDDRIADECIKKAHQALPNLLKD